MCVKHISLTGNESGTVSSGRRDSGVSEGRRERVGDGVYAAEIVCTRRLIIIRRFLTRAGNRVRRVNAI